MVSPFTLRIIVLLLVVAVMLCGTLIEIGRPKPRLTRYCSSSMTAVGVASMTHEPSGALRRLDMTREEVDSVITGRLRTANYYGGRTTPSIQSTDHHRTYSSSVTRKRDYKNWRKGILASVFWVGEKQTGHISRFNRSVSLVNLSSSWDRNWIESFGGYDSPSERIGYRPARFVPLQSPFYVALPYNDLSMLSPDGHKPEAKFVIPWLDAAPLRPWRSAVHGKWVAIRYGGRVCYAQWRDAGPFRSDHWEYVFCGNRPDPYRNGSEGPGIDISPAVRDFLGIKDIDNPRVDWRFEDDATVPPGPWKQWNDI